MEFSQEMIQSVWEKGTVVPRTDDSIWRKDQYEAWIRRSDYGNRKSSYGWEIHQTKPEAQGNANELANLNPLHWENKESKEAEHLTGSVTSSVLINVRKA